MPPDPAPYDFSWPAAQALWTGETNPTMLRTLLLSWGDASMRHKTLLIFLAFLFAGVCGIVAGRMIGWGADAQEETVSATPRQAGGIGGALGQAIGLSPAKPPVRRD